MYLVRNDLNLDLDRVQRIPHLMRYGRVEQYHLLVFLRSAFKHDLLRDVQDLKHEFGLAFVLLRCHVDDLDSEEVELLVQLPMVLVLNVVLGNALLVVFGVMAPCKALVEGENQVFELLPFHLEEVLHFELLPWCPCLLGQVLIFDMVLMDIHLAVLQGIIVRAHSALFILQAVEYLMAYLIDEL